MIYAGILDEVRKAGYTLHQRVYVSKVDKAKFYRRIKRNIRTGGIAMNIAVIGAGVTGLASAARLAAKGHQVTLFEKMINLVGV